MNKRFRAWINITVATIMALSSVFLQGCSGSTELTSGPPVTLVSISVTPANSSIAPGTTAQLIATGKFSNGTMQNITANATWNSTNTGVATISNVVGSQGLATALASIGTTTITAVSSGITGTSTLSTLHVSSIAVSPSTASIAPGTTQQFTATGTLTDGSTTQNLTPFATWTSLNPTSGMVSDAAGLKGLATAGSTPGASTIQAAFDLTTGSATLTSSHVQSIAVVPVTVNVPQGLTQQFTATGTLVDSTTQSLTTWATWTSSSISVATISNAAGSKGLATALTVGSTNIAAVFDTVTSSPAAVLTVTQPVLQSIMITPDTQSIALGLTQQYTAIASYSSGSTPDITSVVTWNSSQPDVAIISNTTGTNGLATSVGQGTTAITASFSGITSNSATLTITPAALVSILVTPISPVISLSTGQTTTQFTATGTFTDGSLHDLTSSVTWVSSSTPVASISNAPGTKGLATISLNNTNLPASTNITASFSGITSKPAILTVTF